jgi:collagen type III alpha
VLHTQGGATRFDHLDLAVQPQRGKALLFFPAFSGGKSDARCVDVCDMLAMLSLSLLAWSGRWKRVSWTPTVGLTAHTSQRRTLHTAEDAAEGCEKWVFQLWLCTGLPRRPPIDAAAAAVQQLAAQRRAAGGGGSSGGSGKKKRPGAAKRKR